MMGSQWIPIKERLPEFEVPCYFLVDVPAYHDTDSDVVTKHKREVFDGYRTSSTGGCGYMYDLMFPDMTGEFYIHGDSETFYWGETDRVVAWMPKVVPEVDWEVE